MTSSETIRLYGTAPDSIVDGPGLRFAVFVQGCTHGCPGCHNEDSQPACGGTVECIDDVAARIVANKLVHGVTLSGGEPFEQAGACAALARRLRGHGLSVWTYTGYRYEDLAAWADAAAFAAKRTTSLVATSDSTASASAKEPKVFPFVDAQNAAALLEATDVLVDGPFVQVLHSYELPWRGSSNQRLIDVAATRAQGRIVLWETRKDFPHKPPSW